MKLYHFLLINNNKAKILNVYNNLFLDIDVGSFKKQVLYLFNVFSFYFIYNASSWKSLYLKSFFFRLNSFYKDIRLYALSFFLPILNTTRFFIINKKKTFLSRFKLHFPGAVIKIDTNNYLFFIKIITWFSKAKIILLKKLSFISFFSSDDNQKILILFGFFLSLLGSVSYLIKNVLPIKKFWFHGIRFYSDFVKIQKWKRPHHGVIFKVSSRKKKKKRKS